MKTLIISDLPKTEELSAKGMSEVRGGMLYGVVPCYWGGYSDSSTKNLSFAAGQEVNQLQNVQTNVGNNVAVLGGFASPSVPVRRISAEASLIATEPWRPIGWEITGVVSSSIVIGSSFPARGSPGRRPRR